MRRKYLQKPIAVLLIVILSAALFGCAAEDRVKAGDSRIAPETADPGENEGNYAVSREMTGGTSTTGIEPEPMDAVLADAYNDYAFRFFREVLSGEDETMMISPYSLWFALGMLANGASDSTLSEIEQLTGMSTEQMNRLAAWFMSRQGEDEVFTIADSVWLSEAFSKEINPDYLKICGNAYRAAVFCTDFTKPEAVTDLNRWVSEHTKGMIPKMNDSLDPKTIMMLVNAIAFDAKWAKPFSENSCNDETFKHEDGTEEQRKLMYGDADDVYYENALCTGFRKSYEGRQYSYVAFLPKEGVTVNELAASLTAESWRELRANAKDGNVYVKIPEYKEEYGASLTEILARMGMREAFTNLAKFGNLSERETHVSEVIQKTFIEVDREGTKAAAVTEIGMRYTDSVDVRDIYRVYLNRSFVYMIIDNLTGCPIFIGTVR